MKVQNLRGGIMAADEALDNVMGALRTLKGARQEKELKAEKPRIWLTFEKAAVH